MCQECAQFGYHLNTRERVLYRERVRAHGRRSHMLQKPRAWAVQATLFDRHRRDFDFVVVHATTGEQWRTRAYNFDEHKLVINRAHGAQYALPLQWWLYIDTRARARVSDVLPL